MGTLLHAIPIPLVARNPDMAGETAQIREMKIQIDVIHAKVPLMYC